MEEMRYQFMTPVEVWRDYDPTAEPLELEKVRPT